MSTLQIYGSYAMTSEEKEVLEQYLTHLNVLGDEGTHPDFDAWYQEVRYAQGPNPPPVPGGSLGAALQGHPQRGPGPQAAGNRQAIAQGLTPALRQRQPGPHRRGVRRPCENSAPGGYDRQRLLPRGQPRRSRPSTRPECHGPKPTGRPNLPKQARAGIEVRNGYALSLFGCGWPGWRSWG